MFLDQDRPPVPTLSLDVPQGLSIALYLRSAAGLSLPVDRWQPPGVAARRHPADAGAERRVWESWWHGLCEDVVSGTLGPFGAPGFNALGAAPGLQRAAQDALRPALQWFSEHTRGTLLVGPGLGARLDGRLGAGAPDTGHPTLRLAVVLSDTTDAQELAPRTWLVPSPLAVGDHFPDWVADRL